MGLNLFGDKGENYETGKLEECAGEVKNEKICMMMMKVNQLGRLKKIDKGMVISKTKGYS